MIKKIQLSVRDAVLAAVIAFASAIAAADGNFTKAGVVAAAVLAVRVGAGVLANRLSA